MAGQPIAATVASVIPAYQQRVIDEKVELDAKLGKLRDFFGTVTFIALDVAEKKRLERQSDAMADYSDVLGERIAAFPAA